MFTAKHGRTEARCSTCFWNSYVYIWVFPTVRIFYADTFFKSAQQILLTAIVFLLRFLMSISFATTKSHLPNIVSVTNMSPLFSNSKHSIPGTKSNLQTFKQIKKCIVCACFPFVFSDYLKMCVEKNKYDLSFFWYQMCIEKNNFTM